MPKSVIKIISSDRRFSNRNYRFQIDFDGFVNLGGNQSFRVNEKGITEINHSTIGTANIYLNGRRIDKVYLPGIFFYDERDSTLIKAYQLSEYKFTINLNYENRFLINPTSQRVYQFLNQKYNNEIIIYDIEQEGSIKKNIILYGTLFYMGIANYGSFRAGLREINKDLQWLGNKIESIYSEDEIRIRERETNLVYPKILIDELDRFRDIQINPSTDEQQTLSRIQELVSLSGGKDNEKLKSELNKLNIPLRTPNKREQNNNFKRYGILREADEEIKTEANIA